MYENAMTNCTTVIIGKAVSETGRVMLAHNEDDDDHVIVRRGIIPAIDHAKGELVPAEKGKAMIPQVPHTYQIYWIEYLVEQGGLSCADAFMNECGVVITSNSMMGSKEDDEDPTIVKDGGIVYSLRRVLAERSSNAREGVKILMQLMDEWGYGSSGRAYTIADKNEAFMFQLVRGHHYMGARIPDDAAVFMPNHYTFHTLHDCPEMFYSADIIDYAVSKGWYKPKDDNYDDFDFAKAYQNEKYRHHALNIYRHKNGLSLLLDREWEPEKEGYPFAVYPDSKIGVLKLAGIMSTHYEGTEDDSDLYGPGCSPHDSISKRRICAGNTFESDIWVLENEPELNCVFTALGRPCQAPYFPLHPLIGLPKELQMNPNTINALKTHLEPHPQVSEYSTCVAGRFRELCSTTELLHRDVKEIIAKKRKELLEKAIAEHSTIKKETAVSADKTLLLEALSEMEVIIKENFNLIEITDIGPIRIGAKDTLIVVHFKLREQPVESTICFGLEFTEVEKTYAKAVRGSLKRNDNGTYSICFDIKPVLALLPFAGMHSFWLGGRDQNDRIFAGNIVTRVEPPIG